MPAFRSSDPSAISPAVLRRMARWGFFTGLVIGIVGASVVLFL